MALLCTAEAPAVLEERFSMNRFMACSETNSHVVLRLMCKGGTATVHGSSALKGAPRWKNGDRFARAKRVAVILAGLAREGRKPWVQPASTILIGLCKRVEEKVSACGALIAGERKP